MYVVISLYKRRNKNVNSSNKISCGKNRNNDRYINGKAKNL